jgi:hypothetical protein
MSALAFAKHGQLYRNGGGKIFVFRDQPLVIVITATTYGHGTCTGRSST